MITQNKFYSYNRGALPAGCQHCVRGEKLVLFVTGICPRRCYFCPISDEKYGKDVTFANERRIFQEQDLLTEADLMQAKGAGITGGDPLSVIDRTVADIQKLKQNYGRTFHLHLYTSLVLVTPEKLQALYDAGLDEIRFHPDFDDKKLWPKLELARQFPWAIGVEIPCIPGKQQQICELIDYIQDKVQFLNLNELEISDNSFSQLGQMGFKTKDRFSYAIEGSLELGFQLISNVEKKGYPLAVHLCTAKLKDKVQLGNRFKRESRGMKRPFDIVTKEGALIRGALYLPELAPGFGYRRKLTEINKEDYLVKLRVLLPMVAAKAHLDKEDYCLDLDKPRILISAKVVYRYAAVFKEFGLLPARVMEYPTADQLEIEIDFV